MDWVTTYVYSLGERDELINGDLPIESSPKKIVDTLKRERGVITPRFIGIYQGRQPVRLSEEDSARATLENMMRYGMLQMTSATVLELKGLHDSLHPQLVCIGYGPRWEPYLVRQVMGDTLGRVAFYPAEALPNFGEKQANTTICLAIEKIKELEAQGNSAEKIRQILKPEIEFLKEQEQTYGFTREERTFIETLGNTTTIGRLITDRNVLRKIAGKLKQKE